MSGINSRVILGDYRAFAMSLSMLRAGWKLEASKHLATKVRRSSTQAAYEVSSLSPSFASNVVLDSRSSFDKRNSLCPWCKSMSPICITVQRLQLTSAGLAEEMSFNALYSKQTCPTLSVTNLHRCSVIGNMIALLWIFIDLICPWKIKWLPLPICQGSWFNAIYVLISFGPLLHFLSFGVRCC